MFIGGEEDDAVDKGRETELAAFFRFNAEEKEKQGRDFKPINMPTYVEMPGKYTFNKPKKQWQVRQKGFLLGRVHTVSPLVRDVFYLRFLLHDDHCRGKISYRDLLTIDGEEHETYQSVCCHLGLLSDDEEWAMVLTEQAETQMCWGHIWVFATSIRI